MIPDITNSTSNTIRATSRAASAISRRAKTSSSKDDANSTGNDNSQASPLRSFLAWGRRNRQPTMTGEEPFHVLVINVGSTLLLICAVVYLLIMVSSSRSFSYPEDSGMKQAGASRTSNRVYRDNLRNLPLLSQQWDPYGISDQYLQSNQVPQPRDTIDFGSLLHLFLPQATLLRNEFAKSYGGLINARSILQQGIQPVVINSKKKKNMDPKKADPSSSDRYDDSGGVVSLAQRLQHAAQNKGTFRILISGSSAPAGIGNAPTQAYSSILEQYITSACAALGISLVIQNAAVEDNSEFPWTWCLGNHVTTIEDKGEQHAQSSYLHPSIDLFIWDFETSSKTLDSFEAFLRHAASIQSKDNKRQLPPLFMFRIPASFTERHVSILQSYVKAGILVDPILLRFERAAAPFLVMPESKRPVGFSSWVELGTTSTSTRLSSRNDVLSVRQHELVAWLITMRILSALELIAADSIAVPSANRAGLLPPLVLHPNHPRELPPPIAAAPSELHYSWTPLVWGVPNDHNMWMIPQTQCRTSFDSLLPSNLQDLIVSGTVGDDDPAKLLLPKSAMFYNSGWVLDLDAQLRRDKRLQAGSNDSTAIDTKKAYYGVSTSGTLRLFIPIDAKSLPRELRKTAFNTKVNSKLPFAKDHLGQLVVCDFALTHLRVGCQFPKDLSFRIDGQLAKVNVVPVTTATNVNNVCAVLEIPPDARLSHKNDKTTRETKKRKKKGMDDTSIEDTLGLLLEIEVSNSRLTWDMGPCSVAQVIWQTKEIIP